MARAGTKVKWTLEIPKSGNRIFIVKGETRLSAATLTEAQQILDELNRQLKVIESVSRQVTRLTNHRDALDKSLKHHKQLFAESCRVLATGRPSAAKHPAQMTQAETSEARRIYFNRGQSNG